MSFLNRAAILNADDFKTEVVNIPEWGGDVMVKAMTGTERDAFEASIVEQNAKGGTKMKIENIRAKLVAKTVIDPESKQNIFTAGDIEAIGKKSAAALDRIYTVASKLSKVTDEDVEELAKNSETDPSDTSTTL